MHRVPTMPLSGIFTPILSLLLALLLSSLPFSSASANLFSRGDGFTGLNADLQFDNYSLILKGQRVFIHSGEFHTFRLPVPDLWADIIQKAKAAGMNTLSVYVHMGLINPSPGVVNFDGWRGLEEFFGMAQKEGVWIILRPGPYINAESTAGGIPHWITSEVAGALRSNATDWKAAWQDYIEGITKVVAPWQINHGGPVIAVQIDNEFQSSPTANEYFAQLEDFYRANNIVVPFTYNDPGMGENFINGTGAVDLYGMDAYPQRYDCTDPLIWQPVPPGYHDYHMEVNPSQPWFLPEFQGGAPDGWGPTSPGYEGCRVLTGADFENVFYKHLWASNAKLLNYYMFYGGTSWGALPNPGGYTSYDYGGAIPEARNIVAKYTELKFQGLFLRSSREFLKTDWIGDSNSSLTIATSVTNPDVYLTQLKNFDTGAAFWIVRQNDSTSTANVTFKLTLENDLQVPLVAPTIALNGRQSKVFVTNYTFGEKSKVQYSTAEVFYAGTIDGRDVLFLRGDNNQAHEVALQLTGQANPAMHFPPQSQFVKISSTNPKIPKDTTIISFLAGIPSGLLTVWDSTTQLILFAETTTAATFWSPSITSPVSNDPLQAFWSIGTNTSILVGGPYLVRGAQFTNGNTLALTGDLEKDVKLDVIAPKSVKRITWNGEDVHVSSSSSSVLTGQVTPRNALTAVTAPKLTGWKFKDSLPEIQSTFDDSKWVEANKTTTNIPYPPYYGDGRVLYGCDYGFCENMVLWRGHFHATGLEKSVNLSINGGSAFAASVWVNDVFLNTSFGNWTASHNDIEETDQKYFFPPGSLIPGTDNVITVVQDTMGLSEVQWPNGHPYSDAVRSPRGIRGFMLDSGNFTSWKVQGKIGGYKNFPDKTRGVLNEGGLFGERKGWHLPSFPTTDWVSRDLAQGLPNKAPGIGFFVTTLKLDMPKGVDAMLSFTFQEEFGQAYRALLFVNGWMMGKRAGDLGPQYKFPVHEGILDYHGENTVAVALWALTPNATVAPDLQLTLDKVVDGGILNVTQNNPKWSPLGRE
ncbi:glycoside hydrolase family 35 protein [Sphaerobolus stellatus SS14]|uniref:beta-galactosidase n=1 Tax=Sphaerobolus stellatus (strain SS14) TaxID=990650 RepID=A0A0C9U6D7_SPHS4|nr:glycoside hydrolase family 35 protein [Sphaerobolus stellatus SS14]